MCLIDISSSSVGFICWASISLATSSSSNDSSFCDKRLLPNIVNQALSEEIQVNLPEIIVQVLKIIEGVGLIPIFYKFSKYQPVPT